MALLSCTLDVDLPLYEPLSSEIEHSKRSDSKLERTKSGVRITVSADDVSSIMATINYWLRLIKASSGVYKVI